jgi:hypothetical protein
MDLKEIKVGDFVRLKKFKKKFESNSLLVSQMEKHFGKTLEVIGITIGSNVQLKDYDMNFHYDLDWIKEVLPKETLAPKQKLDKKDFIGKRFEVLPPKNGEDRYGSDIGWTKDMNSFIGETIECSRFDERDHSVMNTDGHWFSLDW